MSICMNRDNTDGQQLVMVLVMGVLLEKACTASCKPKFWIQKQETVPFKHDSLGQNRNVKHKQPFLDQLYPSVLGSWNRPCVNVWVMITVNQCCDFFLINQLWYLMMSGHVVIIVHQHMVLVVYRKYYLPDHQRIELDNNVCQNMCLYVYVLFGFYLLSVFLWT